MIKRNYVVIAANLVLHSSVVLINLWDVSVSKLDVKLGLLVCKVAMNWLKLVVYKHDGDFETTSDVCTYQGLEVLEYVAIFHALQLAC